MSIVPTRIARLSSAALLVAVCFAQTATRPSTAAARDMTLLEGRGELLTFTRDVTKVAISEPKVADAVVISPRDTIPLTVTLTRIK